MPTAVSRNLGYRNLAEGWLRELLAGDRAPDLAFVQEVLPGQLASVPQGYLLVAGRETPGSALGRTSALLIREGLAEVQAVDLDRPFGALGTYAATAKISTGIGWIWLVSVHASPTRVPQEKLREEFGTRSCEAGPWWSDVFLTELKEFAAHGHDAVIAGDLNEAREYDVRNGHVCGAEFFDAVAGTGFVDVTGRDWGPTERPTRRNPDYQLDRVLASGSLVSRVAVDKADLDHDMASDHAPVWFEFSF